MNLRDKKIIVLRLLDNTGKLLLTKQVDGIKGINSYTLREGKVPAGSYFLQANGIEGPVVKKIFIQ